MSDSDMQLSLKITGQADTAVAAADVSQESIDRLSAAVENITSKFGSLTASSGTAETGVKAVGAAAAGATGAVTEHAAALERTRTAEEQVAGYSGTLARGFAAVGIDAGAAASRVQGLAGAFEDLKGAQASFLGGTAGLIAGFAIFEMLKSGIESAEKLQDAMATMRSTVEAAGGSWNTASASIERFLNTESLVSGFTQGALAEAMNQLITTGHSVADSQTMLAVAEEAAIAKHRDLSEVTQVLIEAESGRTRGLVQMFPAIDQVIKGGGDENAVLQALHTAYGTAVNDTESLRMAKAREGVAWDDVSRSIGQAFLPLLSAASYAMIGALQNAEDLGRGLEDVAAGIGQTISAIAKGESDLAASIVKFANKDYAGALSSFQATGKDGQQLMSGLSESFKGAGEAGKELFQGTDAAARGYDTTLQSIIAHQKNLSSISLQNDKFFPVQGGSTIGAGRTPRAGRTPTPFEGGSDIAPDYHEVQQSTDALTQLQEKLDALPKSMAGYQEALADINQLLPAAISSQKQLGGQLSEADLNLSVASQMYNDYNNKLKGSTDVTAAQKEQLKQYADAVKSAQESVNQLSSAYDRQSATVKTLTTDQANNQRSLDTLRTSTEQFYATTEQKAQSDVATFGMSADQKYTVLVNMYERMLAADGQYSEEAKQAYTQLTQAWEQAVQQRYQAEQQFETSASQHMSSFLDAIVTGHKSMASELKSVYQDIEESFLSMLAQMLAKALVDAPIFQSILGMLGIGSPGGLISGGGVGGDLYGASGGGWAPSGSGVGSILSGGGSAASLSGGAGLASLASSPLAMSAMSSAMSPSGGGGSVGSGSYGGFSGGSGGMSSDATGNPFGAGGSGGGASYGDSYSGGGFSGSSGGAAGGGSIGYRPYGGGSSGIAGLAGMLGKGGIGSILMPILAGGIGGGMLFGGKGDSAIGGAAGIAGILGLESLLGGTSLAGALPALLASGPLGWGLLAGSLLLGAFAGSLFGDHFNIANEPDIGQTQAWGQANADMQGSTSSDPMNANGKQFIMDGSTIQATNGVGWNIMMENFVSKFRANVSQLPPSIQEAFPQIEQLWGGATNQRDFNNDGKDGFLDIGSGKRALWSDFWGVIQTYGQSISSLMSVYDPVESYNASINGAVSQIGSTSLGGGGGFGSPFSMPSPGGGGSSGGGGGGRPTGDLVGALRNNLTLNVNANISSSGLVQQHNLEAALEKAVMAAIANSPLSSIQR